MLRKMITILTVLAVTQAMAATPNTQICTYLTGGLDVCTTLEAQIRTSLSTVPTAPFQRVCAGTEECCDVAAAINRAQVAFPSGGYVCWWTPQSNGPLCDAWSTIEPIKDAASAVTPFVNARTNLSTCVSAVSNLSLLVPLGFPATTGGLNSCFLAACG